MIHDERVKKGAVKKQEMIKKTTRKNMAR